MRILWVSGHRSSATMVAGVALQHRPCGIMDRALQHRPWYLYEYEGG